VRPMAFGGFAGVAEGENDVDYASGRLHAAYLLAQGGGWYLKPQVDGVVTYVDSHGLTETGGGGAALAVGGSSETVFAVSPALEIGSELRFSEISVLRPFLRAGVTWRDGDSFSLDAGFADGPAGTNPFTITTALDDVLADVSAGFDLINSQGAALRLQYDGRFGEETAQNSASIKGSVPF
jgi:outer membrane autotransporter protein